MRCETSKYKSFRS